MRYSIKSQPLRQLIHLQNTLIVVTVGVLVQSFMHIMGGIQNGLFKIYEIFSKLSNELLNIHFQANLKNKIKKSFEANFFKF